MPKSFLISDKADYGLCGMRLKFSVLLLICLFRGLAGMSQVCSALGQNPSTAFPVCGTNTFSQTTVPLCGNKSVPGPCSDTDPITDRNPFWYKFKCFTSGTLGFLITPIDLSDDYDWQLWDVTGHNPNDVYTNTSLFVACNWSGESGLTGASSAGSKIAVCAGYGQDLFSVMPSLIQGHDYLLLISHFTQTQSGYGLSFGGGTASITDTTRPGLLQSTTSCDATSITIQLNKNMKCQSLAANGSDFSLSPAIANIISATGAGCTGNFDMQFLTVNLDRPIPPGNYSIVAKNGSDGNTLKDYCDNTVPVGASSNFTIFPMQPTPMDSMARLTCAPSQLQLIFRKNMRCTSIAADGSDFTVTGPAGVTVGSAMGNCNTDGLSTVINLQLSQPLTVGGQYTITLQNGTDGNTLIDECGQSTPAGSTLSFTIKDTVSANFSYTVTPGCVTDIVNFSHDGAHGVNQWQWVFDNSSANTQQTQLQLPALGEYHVALAVSNGFCADTFATTVVLDDAVKAAFEIPEALCPQDSAIFRDHSGGRVTAWNWDFGNGDGSTDQLPRPQFYPIDLTDRQYPVRLIVFNSAGCSDTLLQSLKVVANCRIDIPSAFTPNGDGLNDYLYPLNAYKASDLLFRVYNRYGQMVFETRDWKVKWDGTIGGRKQPSGNYAWVLSYTHKDTGKRFNLKGNTVLIR